MCSAALDVAVKIGIKRGGLAGGSCGDVCDYQRLKIRDGVTDDDGKPFPSFNTYGLFPGGYVRCINAMLIEV